MQTFGDDDKYTKKSMLQPLQKYDNSSLNFACAYLLLATCCILLERDAGHPLAEKIMNFSSITIEILALLFLRHKIQHRKSVSGISGQTILIQAAAYLLRIWVNRQEIQYFQVEAIFCIISFFIVLDILRAIFVIYRQSYQEDLDVLHAKFIVPGCFALAIILRPELHCGAGYMWSACLYMDVLALLPQIVMMSRGGGLVEAPIAHFVAATVLSRIEDLSDSFLFHINQLQPDEYFSFYIIVFFQGLHLVLAADFMYYYVKAKLKTKSAAQNKDGMLDLCHV